MGIAFSRLRGSAGVESHLAYLGSRFLEGVAESIAQRFHKGCAAELIARREFTAVVTARRPTNRGGWKIHLPGDSWPIHGSDFLPVRCPASIAPDDQRAPRASEKSAEFMPSLTQRPSAQGGYKLRRKSHVFPIYYCTSNKRLLAFPGCASAASILRRLFNLLEQLKLIDLIPR